MSKESVLKILMAAPGKCISGGEISKKCNISRTAVWKAIKALNADGYSIQSMKNTGYVFVSSNDILSLPDIRSLLSTSVLGQSIQIFKTIDSTNSYLKEKTGLKDGHLVISDEQTNGRGRLGRSFYSPDRKGIYMSLFLTPDLPVSDMGFITILAAVSVTRALEKICKVSPGIKWVNDILINGKKVCGILTEALLEAESGTLRHIVLGIGINIRTHAFPDELSQIADSVSAAAVSDFSRNELIAEILNTIEPFYLNIKENSTKKEIIDSYRSKLCMLNQDILVIKGNEQYPAKALDIDKEGHLIVEDRDGNTKTLSSGEISIRRITDENQNENQR